MYCHAKSNKQKSCEISPFHPFGKKKKISKSFCFEKNFISNPDFIDHDRNNK